MIYFVITFFFFLFMIAIMAVGYIFQQKTISGSCGGIASLGVKKVCDCPEPCEKRLAKIDAAEKKAARREAMLNKNRII